MSNQTTSKISGEVFVENVLSDALLNQIKLCACDTSFRKQIIIELNKSLDEIKLYRSNKKDIQTGGRNISFSNLNISPKGRALAKTFTVLISGVKNEENNNYILGGLLSDNNKQLSLQLIRIFCDLEQKADSYELKTNDDEKLNINFFKLSNQIFYHSRKLLALSVLPDIAKFYCFHYMNTVCSNIIMDNLLINIKSDGNKKNKTITQNFSIFNEKLQSIFTKKTEGIHFGATVEVNDGNDFPTKKFFLKAYHGYPAIESKDSNDTAIDTSKMISSTEGSDTASITIKKLDLKEPFLYEFLSQIGLGPNVVFTVNPYINNGFYIFTEDLSDELLDKKFFEASKFQSQNAIFIKELKDLKNTIENRKSFEIEDSLFEDDTYKEIFVAITELSVVTLLFMLDDIKEDNFGFVTDQIEKIMGLFIIDFLSPDVAENNEQERKYIDTDIEKKFLTGKNILVSNKGTGDSLYCTIINSLDILKYIDEIRYNQSILEKNEANYKTLSKKSFSELNQKEKNELSKLPDKINNIKRKLVKNKKFIGKPEKQVDETTKNLHEKIYFGKLSMGKFQSRLRLPVPHVFGTNNTKYYLTTGFNGELAFKEVINFDDFKLMENLKHVALKIKLLMLQRRDDLPVLQNRTNAELIGFKSRGNTPRPKEEGLNLEYIEDAFEDLDQYCNAILSNYKKLKMLLNTDMKDIIGMLLQPIE